MEHAIAIGLLWKLRRVAANWRQQDVASAAGISTTRYSGIERGEHVPTDLESRMVEQFLPPLPSIHVQSTQKFARESNCAKEVVAV
jgi:DNA-binding XRE family transcriptional regulator